MKKDFLIRFSYFLAFFLLVVLVRGWFNFEAVIFVIGGIVGTLLPDVDHLIYVYFLRPSDPISLNTKSLIKNKQVLKAWGFLISTRVELPKLVFHTAYFQTIIVLLSVLVISSSGSFFGKGLVLAFSLHLLIEQLIDYIDRKNLTNWFTDLPITLDADKSRVYLAANIAVLCFLGFFL